MFCNRDKPPFSCRHLPFPGGARRRVPFDRPRRLAFDYTGTVVLPCSKQDKSFFISHGTRTLHLVDKVHWPKLAFGKNDVVHVRGHIVKNGNRDCSQITVVGKAAIETPADISIALAAGARGAVMKIVAFADLIEAIRTVANGGEYVSDELKRILASDPPIPALSPRQQEILESMARGLSNAEIGRQLGITADMVRGHSVELFAKLRAANRAEAVAIAMRKHLLKI